MKLETILNCNPLPWTVESDDNNDVRVLDATGQVVVAVWPQGLSENADGKREWAIATAVCALPLLISALRLAWQRNAAHDLMSFEECNAALAVLQCSEGDPS